MAEKYIDGDLNELVSHLGKLRDATPVDDPNYGELTKQYRESSDMALKAVEKAIDEADNDYVEFSQAISEAIQALKDAQSKIEKVSKAIKIAAKVISVAGKIMAKMV